MLISINLCFGENRISVKYELKQTDKNKELATLSGSSNGFWKKIGK